MVLQGWPVGRMAHAEDCKSFYIGSIPVPASNLFRLSSAVEQSAVNRSVICSNQIVGAKTKSHPCGGIFFGFILSVEQMTEGHRSERLVGENKR